MISTDIVITLSYSIKHSSLLLSSKHSFYKSYQTGITNIRSINDDRCTVKGLEELFRPGGVIDEIWAVKIRERNYKRKIRRREGRRGMNEWIFGHEWS